MESKKRLVKLGVLFMVLISLIVLVIPQRVKAEDTDYSMSLSKDYLTLAKGDKLQLKIVNAPKGSKTTWKSSKKSVAAVSKYGTVTAKKAGNTTVTATVKNADRTSKYTCDVTVTPAGNISTKLSIKEKMTVKTLKSGTEDAVDVELIIPSITSTGNEKAVTKINDFFKKLSAETYTMAKESVGDWKELREYVDYDLNFAFTINYNMCSHIDNLLSFDVYWYVSQGGVHPSHGVNSYVFDLASGEQVTLKDIAKDAGKTEKFLCQKAVKWVDNDEIYKDSRIVDNAKELMEYYPLDSRWCISKDGFEITFSAGEISAYAAGTISISFDIADVAPYLNDYGLSLLMPSIKIDEVNLDSNPSTGYSWVVSCDKEGIVDFGEPEYIQDPGTEGLVGAGGINTWIIKPVAKGDVTLKFEYRRVWDETSESEQTMEMKYYVDEAGYLHKYPM